MKKKTLNCAICGGILVYNEASNQYSCVQCNATHSADLFYPGAKTGKKFQLKRLRLLVAILTASYLFYWLLRIIWFRRW